MIRGWLVSEEGVIDYRDSGGTYTNIYHTK